MYGNPYYQPYDSYNDYLEHHGVKGMKWGIRRYQNENGSLTAAGKQKLKRYKDKEYKRVDKLRAKADDRYSRSVYKRKSKGGTLPSKKEAYNKSIKEAYEKELQVIKKMKFKDMQEDKRVVANQWMKSLTGSAVLSTGVSVLAGGPVVGLMYGPVLPYYMNLAKTRNRVRRYNVQNQN